MVFYDVAYIRQSDWCPKSMKWQSRHSRLVLSAPLQRELKEALSELRLGLHAYNGYSLTNFDFMNHIELAFKTVNTVKLSGKSDNILVSENNSHLTAMMKSPRGDFIRKLYSADKVGAQQFRSQETRRSSSICIPPVDASHCCVIAIAKLQQFSHRKLYTRNEGGCCIFS